MTNANDPTVVSGAPVPRTVTRLGRYTLKQRLGVGGMAEVYLAEQDGPKRFTKKVVIKRILPTLAQDAGFVAMFVREAQVAARLTHTNVVQIYELGEQKNDDGTIEYFIAMEYIDGLTLQRLASASWQKGQAVPVEVVLRTCADAARGLHAAHTLVDDEGKSLGLVHRDISPDNLMVSRDGVTKVLDFGIAKGPDLDGPKTRTGQLRGKVPYMSPEQIQGHALDGRTDLWALGVSMYWLLCGERPFDRGTDYHTMASILGDVPKPPTTLNPGIPPGLERMILALLDKDPAKRPSSGADVADVLEELTPSGTSTGRRSTVAFVETFVHGPVPVGNPLSEAGDKTSNTRPIGSSGEPLLSSPALAQAEAPSPAPRQVTMDAPAAPSAPPAPSAPQAVAGRPPRDTGAVPQNAAIISLTSVTQDLSAATVAQDPAPNPMPDATLALPVVAAAALPVARSAETSVVEVVKVKPAPQGNHPVVDLLAPPQEKSALPAVLAIGGVVVLLLGGGAFGLYKLSQVLASDAADAGSEVVAVADAGLRFPDAGAVVVVPPVIDAVIDAGVQVAAVIDAGVQVVVVPPVVDAGTVAVKPPVVDAGTVVTAPPVVDAGTVVTLSERVTVKAKAPSRIEWRTEGGALVGRGTATLSVARGVTRLVAMDPSRKTEHLMLVQGGKLDYGTLPTGTLVAKQAEGVKIFIERDLIEESGPVAVVAGTYEVRVTKGAKMLLKKSIEFKAGQSVTIDAAKP